jgi:hypothetical protein
MKRVSLNFLILLLVGAGVWFFSALLINPRGSKGAAKLGTSDQTPNDLPGPKVAGSPDTTKNSSQGPQFPLSAPSPALAGNSSLVSGSNVSEMSVFGVKGAVLIDQIPPGRFRTELEALAPLAREKALKKLGDCQVPVADVASLHVDNDGELNYACRAPLPDDGLSPEVRAKTSPPRHTNGPSSSPTSAPSLFNQAFPAPTSTFPGDAGTTGGPTAAPGGVWSGVTPVVATLLTNSVPISSPPICHSKPGAPNVIYLNFGGGTVSGTAWNSSRGVSSYQCLPFNSTDTNLNPVEFSPADQQSIIDTWGRVSENFRPFDVDVTTEKPASVTNNRVAVAMITPSTDANGAALPHKEFGGIAYFDKFGQGNFATSYSPAWCQPYGAASLAFVISHEVGHNMGLSHNGIKAYATNAAVEYYSVTGSGDTSWCPIMGNGYSANVTQWTHGEYFNANNLQDQLSIITEKLSYRSDYSSNSIDTPISLSSNGLCSAGSGILVHNTDANYFSFSVSYPLVQFSVSPPRPSKTPFSIPLDVAADVLSSNGTVVAHMDPQSTTDVTSNVALSPGNYYLRVYGSGCGNPLSNPPLGYTSYGSLGSYTISITGMIAIPPEYKPLIGSQTNLTMTPGGPPPFRFSWTKNNATIPSATNASLKLTNIRLSDAGAYTVTEIDGLGNKSQATTFVVPSFGSSQVRGWSWNDTPMLPAGLGNAVAIEAGSSQASIYALALKTDGTVVDWGGGKAVCQSG